jgi:hypothetical protein
MAVSVGCDRISVRIPRLETETLGGFFDDELLPQVDRYRGTTWVVDLSEYEDGMTLCLAETLARLGEEARWRGCAVTFSGIGNEFLLSHRA